MHERDDLPREPRLRPLARTHFEVWRTLCSTVSAIGVLAVLARAFL